MKHRSYNSGGFTGGHCTSRREPGSSRRQRHDLFPCLTLPHWGLLLWCDFRVRVLLNEVAGMLRSWGPVGPLAAAVVSMAVLAGAIDPAFSVKVRPVHEPCHWVPIGTGLGQMSMSLWSASHGLC